MANASSSSAEPLDGAACAELEATRQKHIKSGIEKTFKKGVEWAKANLSEDSLEDIKEYLTVQDMLLFRCKDAKAPQSPILEKTDASGATTEASTKADISTIPLPVRPSPAKR